MTLKNREINYEQWYAEGVKLFGNNVREWRFVCPMCERITAVKEWNKFGDRGDGMAGFSCIGRLFPKTQSAFNTGSAELIRNNAIGCDYAGGGLFCMSPVKVIDKDTYAFEFAPAVKDAAQ